ncbi:MAG: FAD-dependent monooxygenase [Rhizobiales bacterium]|nr:FAD-dependent monooxygenase [Hyphomicrobiales bacterium]
MTASIVISGFGPAGAATALALYRAGLTASDIAIVDPLSAQDAASKGPDSRILALNAGSRRLLEMLDIWPLLAPHAHPMRSIAISDTGLDEIVRPSSLGFETETDDQPLAHLVPLGLLQSALRDAARAAGIPLIAEHVLGFSPQPDAISLRCSRNQYRPSLLVAADGARSAIRRMAGIPFHGWAYGQTAITAIVEHSAPHHGEAVQHFLPSGPFALLPLDENRSSMVWSERTDIAKRMLELSVPALIEEVVRRAAGWRGEIKGIGQVSSHPLSLGIARRFFADRVALVADAAHVVHPLAGQGLNLGFADAATLAELVVEHVRLGLDPGDPTLLETYQARRRPPAVAMAGLTEGLNRLFSNDFGPVRLVRDIGLGLVNRSDRLRSLLRKQAAGRDTGEPKLFRGEAI